VIDSFKGCLFCVLLLILQCVLSPITAISAVEIPVGRASGDLDLSESSVQKAVVQETSGLQDSLQTQKVDRTRQTDGGFVLPVQQNLAELFGVSEVPVLSDISGHFVRSLAENSMMGEAAAGQVDETTLLESIRAGRNFSRDSLAALARTQQAKAQTGQAFGLLLPSLIVHANTGAEKSKPSVVADEETGKLVSSDTHSRTDASLVLRQPLFDLPSYLDWRRREVIETARGEDYRASDGDTYLTTVNTYLSMVSSRLQTYALRDFETQLEELLLYIEKRASAGAASVSDMARVKARREETLSFRLEEESAHAATWVEFVRLTNLAPQKVRLPMPEDVGASLLAESFDLAVDKAMRYNPEVASLTAEVQAARIDQSAAKGRYLPRLDAEYSYNYSLHAGGDLSSSGQKDQRVMAVLNWDLFSGGRDLKYNEERAARHKELQYRLDDQRRRVVQGLSANYAVLVITRDRIASGYQELKSITIAADAMSKRMLSGNQSLLDLLDVYDRLYRARANLVNLHVLEMNTVAQLVRLTMGTPWANIKGAPFAVSGKISSAQVPEQGVNVNPDSSLPVGPMDEQSELNPVSHYETNDDLPQQAVVPVQLVDVSQAPDALVPTTVLSVEKPSIDLTAERTGELSDPASEDADSVKGVQVLRESGSESRRSTESTMTSVTRMYNERTIFSEPEPPANKQIFGVVASSDSLQAMAQPFIALGQPGDTGQTTEALAPTFAADVEKSSTDLSAERTK